MKFTKLLTYSLIAVLLYTVASAEPRFEFPATVFGLVTEIPSQIFGTKESSASKTQLASAVYKNKILFVGDVLLARNIELLMNRIGDSYPFDGINLNDISTNQFIVGNFESSIPRIHSPTRIFNMRFSVDKEFLPAAKKAGFTHFSLANNHSLDYGQSDFENTKEQLLSSGFETFGNPSEFSDDSVTFLNLKGRTVSIIGLHTLVKQPSLSEINDVLEYAKKKSDLQIIYVHWGTEYALKSSLTQRNLAKQLVEAGADMIIGHHPHVVQEVELIDGVPVFYSLGNYIFDQYFSSDVQEGLVLQFDLTAKPFIQLIPVTSEYSHSQPTRMKETDSQNFLRKLASRSDDNLDDYIMSGVLPLDMLFATSSKMAMMNI